MPAINTPRKTKYFLSFLKYLGCKMSSKVPSSPALGRDQLAAGEDGDWCLRYPRLSSLQGEGPTQPPGLHLSGSSTEILQHVDHSSTCPRLSKAEPFAAPPKAQHLLLLLQEQGKSKSKALAQQRFQQNVNYRNKIAAQ